MRGDVGSVNQLDAGVAFLGLRAFLALSVFSVGSVCSVVNGFGKSQSQEATNG
jgi:hypothetical protein